MDKFKNDKINPLQYLVLVMMSSRALYVGIGVQNILAVSKYDSWISMLLGAFLGFIPILFLCFLSKKGLNLFELINKIFSKFVAKIINFIIVIFLSFMLIILLNDFINFASVKYLFQTPDIMICLLFLIASLFIVRKGLETLGRTSLLLS